MSNIIPVSTRSKALSVALVVPDPIRRQSFAKALADLQFTIVKEFETYPSPSDIPKVAQLDCDVVIVDLDKDVEQSIRVIENICGRNVATTVMAYSSKNESTLMRRSMQAGAREFLIDPLLQETIAEAFTRARSRRPVQETTDGKMLVFAPSKGGVGVTTLAVNFALALKKESSARVAVVDMDFQLGEIAVGLGLTATFSIVDALVNAGRLDRDFLSTLMIRHRSGLAVLGSPEDYNFFHSPLDEGADKLFRILRAEFDYVVVDTGTCHGHIQEALFGMADKLYLVTETTFAALRNAHRLISYLSARDGIRKLEVVVNRFNSRHGKIDENSAVKALGLPVTWRIPNSYAAVRAALDNGVPLAMENSPITRVLVQMARAASGKTNTAEKKTSTAFGLFGLRSLPDPMET
jgi:pilus assembly protein CpaE